MRNHFRIALIIIGMAGSQVCYAQAPAKEAAKSAKAELNGITKRLDASRFLRVIRDDKGLPTALQTAVVRYVPASGSDALTVDLVGAVHIGDALYYRALNQQFSKYDALLFELVAPKGVTIPKGGKRPDNPIAFVQQVAKIVLDLESQMELVDYTRPNFIHADLTPGEMAAAIEKRGDNGLTLVLTIVADILRQQNLRDQTGEKSKPAALAALEESDFTSLLLDPEGSVKIKRLMADQFDDLLGGHGAGSGLGPTLDTILISDRNRAATDVLKEQIKKGRKQIGVFYGAAHMPDFDRRLTGELGLKRDSTEWVTAWDLQPNPAANLTKIVKVIQLIKDITDAVNAPPPPPVKVEKQDE